MGCPLTQETVLLTGPAGFIGSQVARVILKNRDCRIIALVRGEDQEAAARRLSRIWWNWPELRDSIGKEVEVVRGDVREDRLGLDETKYNEIAASVTHVIHTAADLRLEAPMEELRATNVKGVANVLKLAKTAHEDHGLARYSHVSTAYVAGGRTGQVPENALTEKYGFLSNYERSKYEGELLVQAAMRDLPVSVFRPGIVVGDSKTGFVKTFNVLYYPLRLYMTLRPRVIPISGSLKINLVPVDYVADAIANLTYDPRAVGLSFHLTAPHDSLPTVREFVDFTRNWAERRLDLKFPRPIYLPILSGSKRQPISEDSRKRKKGILGEFAVLAPYFNENRQFMRENLDRLLGPYRLNWLEFMPVLLEYAVYMGFMHKSERTVHEQVLFRLDGKSRPVRYHDIIEGGVVDRGEIEVKKDILAATASLRSMGVRPGDRIALVGLNSTRFLILDIAIGLVGAVNVPLYYTSPPRDIDEMLKDCKARMLFVGAPRLLDRADEFAVGIPVVSFCRGPIPENVGRSIIGWEDFLGLGKEGESIATAPIGFEDVATIRYTSSTTGKPKGVVFNHDNLRWMAESLASLPPWESRNSSVAYLSFLPMNHVVEGILGTYSPYYAPAPLDIFFLEDFKDLQKSLPLSRPTVFFSVPRFYEKILERLQENDSYRRFKATRKGLWRRTLRRTIRKSVLRRVGLDRCAQLIVGSAPCGDDLLNDFRDLGIEIHNAYGLTEAPLVTLNRLGRNRIGTVGEPLPMTEVAIAEDGEVLVKGPQVMAGYFNSQDAPFRDGWLLTGDYGSLTPEGSLVIHGRKKELIVTSYGKNVHPMKIESMLKDLPGVVEAMVVGEGRPYCCAIIWVESKVVDEPLFAAIDKGIENVNDRLSNPERLKRWALLPNDLSIEGGVLTANLKLKRKEALARLSDVVAALYGEMEVPRAVLHVGRTGSGT